MDKGVAAAYLTGILLVEGFYLYFFSAIGLQRRGYTLPLTSLLFIGIIALATSSWNYAVKTPFGRLRESEGLGGWASNRMMARSSLLIFIYSLFLLLPLVLTSKEAIDFFGTLTSSLQALSILESFTLLTPVSKLVITQASGLTALTTTSLILGRRKAPKMRGRT